MLRIILLLLPGVLSSKWDVKYSDPICLVRGSTVSIPCTFTYPQDKTVEQVLWCSMSTNSGKCESEPYVYDSNAPKNAENLQYTGDKTSNCSLLISNINFTSSDVYKFRFKTNSETGRWTGEPGVQIEVKDLKVSMTSSRENGTIKVGDSLNLTCRVNCSGKLTEVQWFKNGEPIHQSDPIITFSSVTSQDSGNYSCSMRNFKTTLSEEFRLYVEDSSSPTTFFIIGLSLFSLLFIIAAVILITRRKTKNQGNPDEEDRTQTETVTHIGHTSLQRAEDVLQDEEIQYGFIIIKPKGPAQETTRTEHQNEDETIYSAVTNG
ncbi:HEPACAM family member 2-like isoform X2 [Myxocyprinus asiaticus]|uniref:HEPACAM family member 2-like isoform X2 n=1 Tax=Myxocyprinus asiaticus TaxID=70543 RepID=UPI002223B977|nr:HEPACAM family member 2-like isoform X2 [Myxocyprinus asiaticus]